MAHHAREATDKLLDPCQCVNGLPSHWLWSINDSAHTSRYRPIYTQHKAWTIYV